MSNMENISIVTFNVRGIRDRMKRRTIFRHLHLKYHNHIVILQETHSSSDIETVWQNEWGSKIIFSHGSIHQAGVSIMFPRSFQGSVRNEHIDRKGRVVGARIEIGNTLASIIGVYAPAVDNQEEKVSFFENMRSVLAELSETYMIIGGDFNVHMSPYDTEAHKFFATPASAKLSQLVDEYCLVDIWRHQNPQSRSFTWRRIQPLQQSRLDFIFVNAAFQLAFNIESKISAGVRSDHSAVDIVATPANRQRGPGLWRYNNELHVNDSIFIESVREETLKARNGVAPYSTDTPIGVTVEMLLSNIRVLSIRRCKNIAFNLRKEECELLERVTSLEEDLSTLDEAQRHEYTEAKQRLDAIKTKRGVQAIISSGVKWTEQGEKATKYFLSRGKQLSAQKTITEIKENDDRIVGDRAILQHCAAHYSNVFTAAGANKEKMSCFLNNSNIPKLSDFERQQCEGAINGDECKFALSLMEKRKAPGVTGFTAEFFLHFWNELGGIITEYINDAYEHGFFITQKRGIITLLPKKGDQTKLQNKRPICLLDVIYKIVAKVIAIRIDKVIRKLVSPEQTGFIKGRFIGENIRLISDIIEYCENDKLGGLMVACDYRSAFDSLEHEFIFGALHAYNFGESLIKWVKLLYGDAHLAVINNGYTSPWFKCNRGTFQGSPLSGMLFNLAIEILAINVRTNQRIRGIEISNVETKLSMYADDITAFLKDKESAEAFIRVMDEFRDASGLGLNIEKCNLMWLGVDKHKQDTIREISAAKTVKILGIHFSPSGPCESKNIDPICKKIESVINIWSQRALTLKGRITVCKTLIASQLAYLGGCIEIPNKNIVTLQSKIMKFLWRGRPPKVSQRILCQNIRDGGLNAINLAAFCKALKLGWVRRLYNSKEASWRRILQARIGRYDITDMIQTCLGADDIKRFKIPVFYKDVLNDFQTHSHRPLDTKMNIQTEFIWYNRNIRIAGKTLFVSRMYQAGIKTVNDLTREDGSLMTLHELKRIAPRMNIDFLTYQVVLNGIPQMWKDKLAACRYNKLSEEDGRNVSFHIGSKVLKVKEMRSSHFYKAQIGRETPSAVARWEHYGYQIGSWENIFILPYMCTKSTKLQTLQYRILNRFLPTKKYLFIRNVVETSECPACKQIDTLEHFLFSCVEVKCLWEALFCRINKLSLNSVHTVLFGVARNNYAINLLVLLVKQYIVNCKLASVTTVPTTQGLAWFLKHHINIERQIAIGGEKLQSFNEKWSRFLDVNNEFNLVSGFGQIVGVGRPAQRTSRGGARQVPNRGGGGCHTATFLPG